MPGSVTLVYTYDPTGVRDITRIDEAEGQAIGK